MSQFFETIYCKDGKAFYLEYHTKRVWNTIGKDLQLNENITPPNNGLFRCKVIYNRTHIEDVSYFLYKKREIKKLKIIQCDSIEYTYKYLDRKHIDTLFSQKKECDEILIIKNGLLTDTSIANISIFKDNRWLTPKTPLLKGTTRERLLEEQKIQEADLSVKDLLHCKKIALSNAMIGFDILQNYKIVL